MSVADRFYATSCGPKCCAVCDSSTEITLESIRSHVQKHRDGSCNCDACTMVRQVRETSPAISDYFAQVEGRMHRHRNADSLLVEEMK